MFLRTKNSTKQKAKRQLQSQCNLAYSSATERCGLEPIFIPRAISKTTMYFSQSGCIIQNPNCPIILKLSHNEVSFFPNLSCRLFLHYFNHNQKACTVPILLIQKILKKCVAFKELFSMGMAAQSSVPLGHSERRGDSSLI